MTAPATTNAVRVAEPGPSSRQLSMAAVRFCLLAILALPANDCPAEGPVSFKEQFHYPVPAISPDSQQLLLIAYERLSLADPSTGKILRSNRRNAPERARAVWFPDGQRILTYGPALQVWDGKTLGELSTTPGSGLAVSAAIALDGETVAVGLDVGDIQLYDTKTWKVLRTFKGHRAPVSALVWNKWSDQLFSAGGFGGGFGDPTIHVWNPQTGKSLRSFQADTRQVAAIALSPDEKWLASQGKGDNLSLWDPSTGRKLRDIPGTSVAACVAISPDGRTIASSHDNDVILWSAEGRQLKKLQGHGDWVKHIEFSSDGRLLVTGGGDKLVKVWDVASGKLLGSLAGHTDGVFGVAFSPIESGSPPGVSTGRCNSGTSRAFRGINESGASRGTRLRFPPVRPGVGLTFRREPNGLQFEHA